MAIPLQLLPFHDELSVKRSSACYHTHNTRLLEYARAPPLIFMAQLRRDVVTNIKKLPQDLTEWRTHPRYITSWNHLRRFIAGYGYKLWSFDPLYPSTPGVLAPLGWGYGNPSGFLYTPSQIVPMSPQEDLKNAGASDLDVPGSIPGPDPGIGGLATPRHILWPARHDHGDVVIRVLSVGGDGLHTLKIQRQISTAPEVLIRSNHTLPLFREIVLKDIILGVFPRVTASLAEVFVPYNMPFIAEMNMMEILVQCLEALDFLHQNLIAHLNVTFENFLIDFPPLSHPQARTLAGSPRVFITNFDRAVSFPPSTPITERFCYGEQFSLYQPPQEEEQDSAKDTFLGRKRALESATESRQPTNRKVLKLKPLEIVDSRHRFSPFPVDCWQFASVVLALEPESTEDSGDGFMLVCTQFHETHFVIS
ncbi:hypothetical protein J3R30DRAFT_2188317 [Lentinula aciculospora]|uniref:Protein kinase domain-containing protein n=1 Tax=Lentinula aciculospora TaxID=153920 RepID=A0A9W9AGZ7_9AGAR|nr:hypothetical protein J3R30DRAFT_2188317 [Lentinula aciculospora]